MAERFGCLRLLTTVRRARCTGSAIDLEVTCSIVDAEHLIAKSGLGIGSHCRSLFQVCQLGQRHVVLQECLGRPHQRGAAYLLDNCGHDLVGDGPLCGSVHPLALTGGFLAIRWPNEIGDAWTNPVIGAPCSSIWLDLREHTKLALGFGSQLMGAARLGDAHRCWLFGLSVDVASRSMRSALVLPAVVRRSPFRTLPRCLDGDGAPSGQLLLPG